MRIIATATLAAATLASPLAFAQDWYLGLGIGQGELDRYPLRIESTSGALTSSSFSDVQGSDAIGTVRFGGRFHRHFAVEAAYHHLGEYDFHAATVASGVVPSSARATSFGVSLVGIYPIQNLDLYGRVGYARTELKGAANDTFTPPRERFNEAVYGLGARWNLWQNYGMFVEYQRHDKLSLDGYFIGMDIRF